MEDLVRKKYINPTCLEVEVIKRSNAEQRGVGQKLTILLQEIQAIGTAAFFGEAGKYAYIIAQGNCYETRESFSPLMERLRALYDQPGHNPVCKATGDGGFLVCDLFNSCFFSTVGTTGFVNLWAIHSMDYVTHEITFTNDTNTKRHIFTTQSAWDSLSENRKLLLIHTQGLSENLILEAMRNIKVQSQQKEQLVLSSIKKLIDVNEKTELSFGIGCLNIVILLLVVLPLLIVILCKI